ncbi:MAG: hypothetical protein QM750_09405 [Rubrivivax sp.]
MKRQTISAQIIGALLLASEVIAQTPSGTLLIDRATGDSNELIVMISYENRERLLELSGDFKLTTTAPAIERTLIDGIAKGDSSILKALASPVYARYAIDTYRMSDSVREKFPLINSNSDDSNPRERLQRYLVLRYNNIPEARSAQKKLSTDKIFSVVNMNSSRPLLSAAAVDPYFSPESYPVTYTEYQWGMWAMHFPQAWEVVDGHAYVGVLDAG